MTLRRTMSAVFLAAGLSFADSPALAGEAEQKAADLFAAGEAAFAKGDYRGAAGAFEAAYEAKHHPAVLWNAARSWERAGEEVAEATDLERYVREAGPDAPYRDRASKRLVELGKRIGRVELHAQGVKGVEIDGSAASSPSQGRVVFVAPGEHVATASAPGGSVRKVFTVGAGETISVVLEPAAPPTRRPPAAVPPRAQGQPDTTATRPLPSWVAFGGGALVVLGGTLSVVSGLDTVSKAHAFDAAPSQATLDAGNAAQTRTNVAIGMTAALAVLTAACALFFVEWGDSR